MFLKKIIWFLFFTNFFICFVCDDSIEKNKLLEIYIMLQFQRKILKTEKQRLGKTHSNHRLFCEMTFADIILLFLYESLRNESLP